jgi:MoxR-like ATPase
MQRKPITISSQGRTFDYLLEPSHHWAILAAVGAQRPLLVQGEPGVGKSQLALAASTTLRRPLIRFTVDSNTEATDLLYRYDSVRRLAEAQVQRSILTSTERETDGTSKQNNAATSKLDPMAIDNFVSPGPLWWALDWEGAATKSPSDKPQHSFDNWQESQGVVILIDEIDKADAHVPNGLLEVLGENRFVPLGREKPISLKKDHAAPLVVITSNEDRILPPAFVRRCVVLKMELPGGSASEIDDNSNQLVDYLEHLGKAHFKDRFSTETDGKSIYRAIAEQLAADRFAAIQQSLRPFPGPAEYLDILRAIEKITEDFEKEPEKFPDLRTIPKEQIPNKLAEVLRSFVFKKSSARS